MTGQALPQTQDRRASTTWLGLAMLALIALPFLLPSQAHAASKTWDGGCGVDTKWSCADNWSDNIVPGSTDTATFNATSTNNSTVDAGFAGAVATIDIKAGYAGTISLSRSLTLSTSFSQADGTFSAGSQTLDMAAFKLSGGSFTASSGTTSISKALTISGSPTFNANGGTVNFDGTAPATLSCNNASFNLVTFTNTGTKTVNSDCNLQLGKNPTVGLDGQVVLNGTLSGSGTLTKSMGALVFNNGSALSGFSGLITGNGLRINGGTYDFGNYTTFDVTGVFTLNAGASFTAPSKTAYFGAGFTLDPASTFNANGGKVVLDGTVPGSYSCGNETFNLVSFAYSGNNRTVNSDCTMPLGKNPVIGGGSFGGVNLRGTLTGSGTLKTANNASLILSDGYALTGFSLLQPYGLAINSSSADLSEYTSVTVSGNLTINSGGTLIAPDSLRIGGNFTDSGDFDANEGRVLMIGTDQTISGNTTFHGLTKIANSAATLTFNAGDTQTVQGLLILKGVDASTLLALVSKSPGTPWLIDNQGTTTVRYVSATDSTNLGAIIQAHNSTDGGGNTGWSFPGS
jgi:hypothetical protein